MYPILLQLQLKLQFACREQCKDGGGGVILSETNSSTSEIY